MVLFLIFLNKRTHYQKERTYLLIFFLYNLEEKQQTTLTEWYSAQENTFKPDSQRQRAVASVSEEYDLLDDGGDAVFSQLVRCYFNILVCNDILSKNFVD